MKNEKTFEKQFEQGLEKLMTHPLFMESMSILLNLNSYRRIFFKESLSKLWKTLELPNKHDQEKTLFLMAELQHKIMKLERELESAKNLKSKALQEDSPMEPLINFEHPSLSQRKYKRAPLKV